MITYFMTWLLSDHSHFKISRMSFIPTAFTKCSSLYALTEILNFTIKIKLSRVTVFMKFITINPAYDTSLCPCAFPLSFNYYLFSQPSKNITHASNQLRFEQLQVAKHATMHKALQTHQAHNLLTSLTFIYSTADSQVIKLVVNTQLNQNTNM